MLGHECGATGQLVEQGGGKDEEGGLGVEVKMAECCHKPWSRRNQKC